MFKNLKWKKKICRGSIKNEFLQYIGLIFLSIFFLSKKWGREKKGEGGLNPVSFVVPSLLHIEPQAHKKGR